MDRTALYQTLPPAVTDYLFDSSKEEPTRQALEKYHLTDDQFVAVLFLADDVVLKVLSIADLPAKIKEASGVPDASSLAIAKDLVGARLLPLKEFISGLDLEVTRLGIDTKAYNAPALEKPKLTPEAFVKAEVAQVVSLDEHLKSRLEFILVSYLRAVRTADQAVSMMTRSAKVGGLDLPEDKAKALIALVDQKKAAVEIVIGEMPRKAEPKAPRPEKPTVVVAPTKTASSLKKDDDLEIKKATQKIKEAAAPRVEIGNAPQQILKVSGLTFASPELEIRFKNIVLARLRDLRDGLETKALLAGPVANGGLALSEGEATKVLAEIESVVNGLKNESSKMVAEDKERFAKMQAEREQAKMDKEKRSEAELAQRYESLTGKSLTPPAPKPVMPKLSQVSLPPVVRGERPQVADVKYVQKLVGPVEELQNMNLVDFRRLASDPSQAAAKIQDKIELLRGESYAKMVEGVKAWRSSEIYQLYVSLSGEALRAGKAVEQVVKEREASGKPTLTAEDVRAVVKLNTSLRF